MKFKTSAPPQSWTRRSPAVRPSMLPSNNFLDIRITMSMMVKMVMGRLLWWWWPSMLPSILSQDILIWWSRLRGPFWVKKHAEMKWNFSWRRCWTLKRSTSAMITNYLRIQWEAESSTASYVYFTHLEMANLNNLKSSLCSEFLTLKRLFLKFLWTNEKDCGSVLDLRLSKYSGQSLHSDYCCCFSIHRL